MQNARAGRAESLLLFIKPIVLWRFCSRRRRPILRSLIGQLAPKLFKLSIQKFGFINGVDNINWPPYRDSKERRANWIRSDEGLTLETSAFRISVLWPIYIINSVDKTKLLYTTSPPTQHHSFFRHYPLHSFVVQIKVRLNGFNICFNVHYYQYARPNDKLPSVKRAFLRAKGEMCGLAVWAENTFAALILIGCKDVKQLRSANEILRIPFQCQSWREVLGSYALYAYRPLSQR